jgi:DNA-binding transcriptional regulator YdaS (Cro superfamily)
MAWVVSWYGGITERDVDQWTDIVKVAAGRANMMEPETNGTLVAASWEAEIAKRDSNRVFRRISAHKHKSTAIKGTGQVQQ